MAFNVIGLNPRTGYAFERERAVVEPLGATVTIVRYENDAQLGAAIAGADALIMGGGFQLNEALIGKLAHCKLIINGAVGVDRIDVEAATRAGIPVANVPDVWINEVADHAMMLLLAVARKLPYATHMAKGGRWAQVHSALAPVPRLQGKTLGLVAFGNIARLVARRAQAFGLRVVAFDPIVPADVFAEHGVEQRSLEEMLRESDFVSAHAPYNRHTHHLMSDAQFDAMKPTAIFVNTGRGRVVDEEALIRALRAGKIAAAGLDVLAQEPPDPSNPLLDMPNVLVTPHTAFYSDEAFIASRIRVGEEIANIIRGERPRNVVNPAVYGA
jgi:D-3-phosphoglycerate dehydrogenase